MVQGKVVSYLRVIAINNLFFAVVAVVEVEALGVEAVVAAEE